MKKVATIFAFGLAVGFLIAAFQTKALSLFQGGKMEKTEEELIVAPTPSFPASDIGHLTTNLVPKPITTTITTTEAEAEKMAVPKAIEKPKVLYCPKANTLTLDAFLYPMSKTFFIDHSYIPEDLVQVPSAYVKNNAFFCMTKDALTALETMFADAREAGYSLFVTSGFRSGATQQSLFNYYTGIMGLLEAERRSAHPGHSEHQLGTAIDITGGTTPATSQAFGQAPEGIWVKEHAREYGFVLSYEEGKEDVTGYMYEPWHFRYVSEEVAEEVDEEEVTLGEYLLELYEVENN